MYKQILIPIALDHNPHTEEAFEIATKLLEPGGQITALSVQEAISSYVAPYLPEGQEAKNLARAEADLKAEVGARANIQTRVVIGHVATAILECAEKQGADCIVIASHRPGLQDYLLGSTAARVVRHARCAVHVVR